MVLQKKIRLDRNEYIERNCTDINNGGEVYQFGLLDCDANGFGFDAALGFSFMHILMSISGWGGVVVMETAKNFLQNQIAISSVEIFFVEPNTNVPVASNIKLKI